jgi:predicted transcriptional regulator
MSELSFTDRNVTVSVHDVQRAAYLTKLGKVLSVPDRVRILRALSVQPMNLHELSVSLSIPFASVSRHVDALAAAGLVCIKYRPGPKGHTKLCIKTAGTVTVRFDDVPPEKPDYETAELPVGLFSECSITTPCGMKTERAAVGHLNDPAAFYSAERALAENLWFNTGFVSYRFPLRNGLGAYASLAFSFEICSECAYYNNDWPSDITLSVNDTEAVTFTSPGDFGGRRGIYTPDFWSLNATQFGIMQVLQLTRDGTFLNGKPVNDRVRLDTLAAPGDPCVKLTIAVKETAKHRGGVNLFGKHFGDFAQAIVMTAKK